MIKVCEICGKEFETKSRALCCSDACLRIRDCDYNREYKHRSFGETHAAINHPNKHYDKTCTVCGAKFVGYSYSKYCCTHCADRAARKQKHDAWAAKHGSAKPRKYPLHQQPKDPKPEAKPAPQPKKQHLDHLDMVAKAASEAGMSYGMYVAKQRLASQK